MPYHYPDSNTEPAAASYSTSRLSKYQVLKEFWNSRFLVPNCIKKGTPSLA